ncbi:MAG: nuclear transport factor 2 family protein [Solirubrobacterales bacterium]|nr:nuclear transport factor 2 family protein [Solirubrobacterales bacterium]
MSQELVELVRRGYEAARRGDLGTMRELLDPDVMWHGGDPAAACQNRRQALAWMGRPERGPIGELVEVIDAGEQVVVIMRRTGEDGESELVANLTTFRDGRVIEMVHYPDPDDARRAAGVL